MIVVADIEDSLETLFDKLSKKTVAELNGRHVRPGWVKYEWNNTVWNLDDGTPPEPRSNFQLTPTLGSL